VSFDYIVAYITAEYAVSFQSNKHIASNFLTMIHVKLKVEAKVSFKSNSVTALVLSSSFNNNFLLDN